MNPGDDHERSLRLHRYLDGELSADERLELESASDPELREHLDELREISSLLREVGRTPRPAPVPPGDLHPARPSSAFALGSSLAATLLLGVALLLVPLL